MESYDAALLWVTRETLQQVLHKRRCSTPPLPAATSPKERLDSVVVADSSRSSSDRQSNAAKDDVEDEKTTEVVAKTPSSGENMRDHILRAVSRRAQLPGIAGNDDATEPVGRIVAGRVASYSSSALRTRCRIAAVRRAKHREWLRRPERQTVHSLSDLDASLERNRQFVSRIGRSFERDRALNATEAAAIGKRALDLSNEFRRQNGRTPLRWHQSLSDIGADHCRSMSTGAVAFGHDGFSGRVQQFPFPAVVAAENVALNRGDSDPAKAAVDGWIGSEGHRKNLLLTNAQWCGIGVFQSLNGTWYFTQLFAASRT